MSCTHTLFFTVISILVLGRDLALETRPGDLRASLYVRLGTHMIRSNLITYAFTRGVFYGGVVSWFLGIRMS